MQGIMFEFANVDDEENGVEVDWMASTPADFERLQHKALGDLSQPPNYPSDLMYKSVGIRDSRQCLQLGLSMWRLSWITFISLHLTFVVAFFGMDVSRFADNPGIGWYFVAAAILMVMVMILCEDSTKRARSSRNWRTTAPLLLLNPCPFGLRPLTHQEMRRQSKDRPSIRGSSDVIIVERNLLDSESDPGEGASRRYSSISSRASQ